MSRIELRNTYFRLVDGHSNTAEVMGTPNALDTEIDIDNLGTDAVIPPSARFTVVGSEDVYIVQTSESGAQLSIDLNTPSSGIGTLTIENLAATVDVNFDDAAADVLASIEADANVTAGDFTVTGMGTSGDPFLISAVAGDYKDVALTMSFVQGTLDVVPVTSQTYPGGVTRHITFSPGFATAQLPSDGAAITFTGRTLTVKVGDGTFTHNQKKQYNYDLDRDQLDTVRKGPAQPMEWKLDLVWEYLTAVTGAETPTAEDVFDQVGPAADWVSSSSDPCEPYAINIEIENIPDCGSAEIETITIPDCRYEDLAHDVRAATISATGKSNSEVAIKSRRPKITVV